MKVPYNCLRVQGRVLFATRGGRIHSFSTEDGSHISTWKHPDAGKPVPEADLGEAGKVSPDAPVETTPVAEPPLKKQRLGEVDVGIDEATEETTANGSKNGQEGDQPSGKKASKRKKGKAEHRGASSFVPDQPVISLMTTTTDNQHLVAVSGHDKCIWVFKLQGSGQLEELSKRTMPKRPSAIVLSPDDQTILSADKFGDVYSLPLIPPEPSPKATPDEPPVEPQPAEPIKLAANTLTVHSQRNRRALEAQKKQASKGERLPRAEGPTFAHSLLLGHVSMLASLILASHDSRRYIITADRDEHIRVSRFIPQAHVIENFCLGHSSFISSLSIPPLRQEILVSGGGDNELFVWDWRSGKLISKMNLLGHVQDVSETVTKIAVSKIQSSTVLYHNHAYEKATTVFAICEDVPAIFCFALTEQNCLAHSQTVLLPGNPLDLAPVCSSEAATRLILAIDPLDPQTTRSLLAVDWDRNAWTVQPVFEFLDGELEGTEVELSLQDVRKLLYTTESLRKLAQDEGSDEG